MKTAIYYFSGRGNTYHTARSLAERLEDAVPLPMSGGVKQGDFESIGIVTSVVDLGIPSFVRRFIKKLKPVSPAPYVFAVITCGGMPGASMAQVKKLLGTKGFRLSSGFILKFGLEPWEDAAWNEKMAEIAAIVKGKTHEAPEIRFFDRFFAACANALARVIVPAEDKKFTVSQDCNGCGTCLKVCPAGNIRLSDGKPSWLHRCTQCAACFGWCPRRAISGTNLASKTFYVNPHVKLSDMLLPVKGEEK
jgi:ferredoxin/flavodoxin